MSEVPGSGPGGERAAVGVSRRVSNPAAGAWDPFERVYAADGSIDREYASKRLPHLIELIRKDRGCFELRVDIDRLTEALLAEDASALRDAASQEAFEAALRAFSENHLHEVVDEATQQTFAQTLFDLARDDARVRRDRAAAALGAALVMTAPDAKGLRGRGLFDIVLRVTMEEQTAQENLRQKARESDGGLTPADLEKFWSDYPALKWRHEERYRREVGHVLREIEADRVPAAVSVDLGMRGAARLLGEVAKAKAEGRQVEAREAEAVLRRPFVEDMADDGGALVAARWRVEMAEIDADRAAKSDERRAAHRTLEIGARLVEEGGPGADPILFYLYMRAVVQGHYHVRDDAELEAAKALFSGQGLVPEGALSYAAHLAGRGDPDSQRRVLNAAFELWPDHADVRAAAERAAQEWEAAARGERLGPTYAESEAAADAAPPAEDAEEPPAP